MSRIKWSNTKHISYNFLDGLFEAIGWSKRGKKKWNQVLHKSDYVVSAWDGKKLVGLGRIMQDGVMCMFYDVGVHPEYQGKRIGSGIMLKLISKVKGRGYTSIGLFAWEKNPGNIEFYEKHGFKKTPTGMELIKYMKCE